MVLMPLIIALLFPRPLRSQILGQTTQKGVLEDFDGAGVGALFRPDRDVRVVQSGRVGEAEDVVSFCITHTHAPVSLTHPCSCSCSSVAKSAKGSLYTLEQVVVVVVVIHGHTYL